MSLFRLVSASQRLKEELRRREPHRFVTSADDVLFVENVAHMLGCSVDHVRRIPRIELPTSRQGRRVVYLREDVVNYIRRHRNSGPRLRHEKALWSDKSDADGNYDPVAAVRCRPKK